MKTSLLFLSCAATLAMASCSQEKTVDTTTTEGAGTVTTTTTTTTSPAMYTDEAYNSRADRIAADMAGKMKLDDAMRTKVRTVYYNRSKRIGDLQSKYATDTTGLAAEMRTVYMDADNEMKTVFTDPAQYSAYETSRSDYYEDRYMDDAAMSTDASMSETGNTGSADQMSTSNDPAMAAGAQGATNLKVKAEDGSKLKIKDNGKVKTKDAEGNKEVTK